MIEGVEKQSLYENSQSSSAIGTVAAPYTGVFSSSKRRAGKGRLYYIPCLMQKIGYSVFYVLHHLFVHIKIVGRENISNLKGPVIFAVNHTGELDVTAIPLALPFFSRFFPIYFLTNPDDEYKGTNIFGWRSYIYGGKFFDILGGCQICSKQKNYAVSLRNQVDLLKRGNSICIFPEGHMTLDGHISKAHGGLGYLVHTTGATVVPIAMNTFYGMTWRKYFSFKEKVSLTICKPMFKGQIVNVENPTVEDFRAAGEKVLERIKEVLKK